MKPSRRLKQRMRKGKSIWCWVIPVSLYVLQIIHAVSGRQTSKRVSIYWLANNSPEINLFISPLTAAVEATAFFLWPINERLMPAIKINDRQAKAACGPSCLNSSCKGFAVELEGKRLPAARKCAFNEIFIQSAQQLLWQDDTYKGRLTCWVYDKVAALPFTPIPNAIPIPIPKCSTFTASIYLTLCATQRNASSGRWKGFPRALWCLLSVGYGNG